MANEKRYADGIFGKVFTFNNGGEVYKVSIKVEDFAKFVKENAKNGYLNLDVVKQMKDPTKLSISLDTFEPKPKEEVRDDNSLPF